MARRAGLQTWIADRHVERRPVRLLQGDRQGQARNAGPGDEQAAAAGAAIPRRTIRCAHLVTLMGVPRLPRPEREWRSNR
ncbi:hypothetical protein M2440_004679 [Methylorubrum extorquens]|nr:hypothetical protein [Methylorubrum extorquens]